jgi:hypothetical protein
MSEVYVYDFETFNGTSAGNVAEFKCPKCGTELRIGEYQWWKNDCDCFDEWSLVVKGIKYDD